MSTRQTSPFTARGEPQPPPWLWQRPGSADVGADPDPRTEPDGETAPLHEAADAGGTPRAAAEVSATQLPEPPAPRAPRSLREAGIGLGGLADLALKLLYLHGALTGGEVALELRLPFPLVEEPLRFLKEQRCAEVTGGDSIGPVSQRFTLTELGRIRARDVFEQCRYVGPAPVTLAAYAEQCRAQSLVDAACRADLLADAFQGLVLRPGLLDEIGAALCSGRAIFLYGPSGNGKTQIARRLGRYLHAHGGAIYVPYALDVDGAIVTVFDPSVHRTVDGAPAGDLHHDAASIPRWNSLDETPPDRRWRRIRRPILIAGGELTLDMLDLRHNPASGYYTAPLHIKANGGLFLIDDFGRQIVDPRELLNRWILPLEERFDFLSLATGRKVAVPFEQLTIFSTNLEPHSLMDEAFLRRIRHKIFVGPPSREMLAEILHLAGAQQGLEVPADALDSLYSQHYSGARPPRGSDPRDLLEIAAAICRFRGESTRLDPPVLSEAAQRLFGSA